MMEKGEGNDLGANQTSEKAANSLDGEGKESEGGEGGTAFEDGYDFEYPMPKLPDSPAYEAAVNKLDSGGNINLDSSGHYPKLNIPRRFYG